MATTKAPLFGLDASGTLGGSIVFSKWRGRTYVRRHVIPANPRSGLQVGMRSVFKYVTQDWASLSLAQQASWENLAAVDNITELNAMVRDAQRTARRNLGWRETTAPTGGTSPDAPTSPTATAQAKTLVLNWTRPVSNQGNYATLIWRSPAGSFTRDISLLVGVVRSTVTTFTDIGLETGVEQFYEVAEMLDDGTIGTSSVEFSGTPL